MTYEQIQAQHKAKTDFFLSKSGLIFSSALVIFGALMMFFPYFYMFITALKTPQEVLSGSILRNFWPSNPNWNIFIQVFSGYQNYNIGFLKAIGNTLIVEASVITIGTFFSSLSAFAFAKMHFRHKKILLIVLMSSLMIPYAAVMLPQYRAFYALGLVNTLWPLIIPGFFGNMGMTFFLITSMKVGIPDSLIEESRVEGAGWFHIYRTVALPLTKPAIIAQVIFWFVGIWNDFFGPSIYLTNPNIKTVQVLLISLNSTVAQASTDIPFLMAAAFLSSLPIIVLFLVFHKTFIKINMMSGIKG